MAFSCVLETPYLKIFHTAATKVPPPGDTDHVIIRAKTLQLWYLESFNGRWLFFRTVLENGIFLRSRNPRFKNFHYGGNQGVASGRDRPYNYSSKNPSIMLPRKFLTEEGCFLEQF